MTVRRPVLAAVSCVLSALVVSVLFAVQAPLAGSVGAPYKLRTVDVPGGGRYVARWNPCAGPIGWQVNVGAVAGAAAKREVIAETSRSLARVSAATGLRFAYQGTTTFVPSMGNQSSQPAALVVAFVRPSQTDWFLGGSVAGSGGSWVNWNEDATTGSWSVWSTSGYAVIDEPQTRSWSHSMKRSGVTRPNIILHELGHVVGLDHVRNPHEVMNPSLSRATPGGHFGPGDLRGLRAVGAGAGC